MSVRIGSFEALEATLKARTNFELRRPPPGGWGLDRMDGLLASLGSPQLSYPVVHVAGTTGKGTTCSALASVLDAAGLKVGLTTSPHLVDLRERIRVGASPASDALWLESAEEVLAAANQSDAPTYFELVIAMAFVAFRRAAVDVAVVEVGLGGRLDATNLVQPAVSVITRIGLDHCELLGADLRSVANEKAGIVKAKVPVVIGAGPAEAEQTIRERAQEVGAPVLVAKAIEVLERSPGRTRVRVCSRGWTGEVTTPLTPRVAQNLALVAVAVEALGAAIGRDLLAALPRGLARVRWRGRFDVLSPTPSRPRLVIDGAHDPDSVSALLEGVKSLDEGKPVVLLGMLKGKRTTEICALLAAACCEAFSCDAPSPRALPASSLRLELASAGLDARATSDLDAALALAQARALELNVPLVVAGSLYLAGAVLAKLAEDVSSVWGSSSRGP